MLAPFTQQTVVITVSRLGSSMSWERICSKKIKENRRCHCPFSFYFQWQFFNHSEGSLWGDICGMQRIAFKRTASWLNLLSFSKKPRIGPLSLPLVSPCCQRSGSLSASSLSSGKALYGFLIITYVYVCVYIWQSLQYSAFVCKCVTFMYRCIGIRKNMKKHHMNRDYLNTRNTSKYSAAMQHYY